MRRSCNLVAAAFALTALSYGLARSRSWQAWPRRLGWDVLSSRLLVLALGQTAGTPLFGATLAAAGVLQALVIFAVAACVAIALYP